MSGASWQSRSEIEKARIETAFSARHAADLWLDTAGPGQAKPAALPILYRAAKDPTAPLPAALVAQLATDTRLKADFDRLLSRIAACRMPRAAAASSGSLDRREAQGFVLRIRPSRADPDQVYLLIDIPDRAETPQVLMARDNGEILRRALGEPQDGMFRLILERSDPLLAAIGDPATEIDLI